METTITATELADHLSDILHRVRCDGERFVVEENGKRIAVLPPHEPKPGVTGRELLARLGDLRMPGDGFADDLEAIQASQPMMRPIERTAAKPGISWQELAAALRDIPWPDEDFAKELEDIHAAQPLARIPEWPDR